MVDCLDLVNDSKQHIDNFVFLSEVSHVQTEMTNVEYDVRTHNIRYT